MPLAASPLRYTKYIIRALEWTIPPAVAYLNSLLSESSAETNPLWMRVQVVQTRGTPAGTSEDVAIFTMDIVNITGGAVDNTWTAGDFTSVNAAISAYLTAIKAYHPSSVTYTQLRYYSRMFNPLGTVIPGTGTLKPFADSGPPANIAALNIVGTGTTPLPYQVAATVTERTALPAHWGRWYLPSLTTGALGTNGRLDVAGFVTTAMTAVDTMTSSLQAAGFYLVVPVTQVAKQEARGLLGVNQLVMDDIPDVQRSRRGSQPASRTVKP